MGDPTHVVDKQQRPIQNTYRDDVERFHRLGTQLRLDLDDLESPARGDHPNRTGAGGLFDASDPSDQQDSADPPEQAA